MPPTVTLEPAPPEIVALQKRVDTARLREPLEGDPALYSRLSCVEKWHESFTARRLRSARRRERRNAGMAEIRAEARARRARGRALRIEQELAAVASAEVRRLRTYQRAMWTSRALLVLIVGALAWSAVTVQKNLASGLTPRDPQWWLGFFVEATLSGFVIAIMVLSTTATTWGIRIDRRQVVGFELVLIAAAVGLNAGPHIADQDWGKAGQYSVAPIMVGAGMWLHGWISGRYADLLDHAESVVTPAHPAPVAHASLWGEELVRNVDEVDEFIEVRALATRIVREVIARQSPLWRHPDQIERVVSTVEQILDAYDNGSDVDQIADSIGIKSEDVDQVLQQAVIIVRENTPSQ